MSSLSKRLIETLVHLVEIKLSCLDVIDREDAREKVCLENARRELVAMMAAEACDCTRAGRQLWGRCFSQPLNGIPAAEA